MDFKNISEQTNTQLYQQSLILSILLYWTDTWRTKKDEENRLNVFKMSCLHRIPGVSRLDQIRNPETRAYRQSKHQKTEVLYLLQKFPQHKNLKIALEGQAQGITPQARPPKKWLDCLSKDRGERSIPSLYQAGRLVLDRKNKLPT